MTNDRQMAQVTVAEISRRTLTAYLYLLPNGLFYASPTHPTMMNNKLVATAMNGRVKWNES